MRALWYYRMRHLLPPSFHLISFKLLKTIKPRSQSSANLFQLKYRQNAQKNLFVFYTLNIVMFLFWKFWWRWRPDPAQLAISNCASAVIGMIPRSSKAKKFILGILLLCFLLKWRSNVGKLEGSRRNNLNLPTPLLEQPLDRHFNSRRVWVSIGLCYRCIIIDIMLMLMRVSTLGNIPSWFKLHWRPHCGKLLPTSMLFSRCDHHHDKDGGGVVSRLTRWSLSLLSVGMSHRMMATGKTSRAITIGLLWLFVETNWLHCELLYCSSRLQKDARPTCRDVHRCSTTALCQHLMWRWSTLCGGLVYKWNCMRWRWWLW